MAFSDPTESHLRRLEPDTAQLAFWLVLAARQAGVPLWISDSVRTTARQADLVRSGASLTNRSRHLVGRAFDVDVLGFGRDEVPTWFWYRLGPFAERLGLRWGGRISGLRDFGHFETSL